ncbi:MAG: LysR family transcriptional regulator [Deltaproteobacteria bacterium]|nr:LysR family transcriptional regulator [Deltaproteobacteria bacterium]
MIPSSAELHYFLEVAQTLNLSRAAERLGITQPTLSLAIRKLERNVGAELLIRSKIGVKLTHAGQRFVAQARNLFAEWERMRGDAIKAVSEIGGRYIIGCHPSVALYSLPNFLPELMEKHSNIEVKLVHDLSRRITERVISFEVDFGIVVNPVAHPDLVIKFLAEAEVSLYAGPGKSSLQDPTSEDGVLICDSDLIQTQSLLKEMAAKKIVFRRVITSSNLEVIRSLVAAGAGIGILPGRVAQSQKGVGLRIWKKDAPKFHDRICLIYRKDAQNTKSGRVIADLIVQNFGKECF